MRTFSKVGLAALLATAPTLYSTSAEAAPPKVPKIDLSPRSSQPQQEEPAQKPRLYLSPFSIPLDSIITTPEPQKVEPEESQEEIERVHPYRTIYSVTAAKGDIGIALPFGVIPSLNGTLQYNGEKINLNDNVLDTFSAIGESLERPSFEYIDTLASDVSLVTDISSLQIGGISIFGWNKIAYLFRDKMYYKDNDEEFRLKGSFNGTFRSGVSFYTSNMFTNDINTTVIRHGMEFQSFQQAEGSLDIDISKGEGVDLPFPAAAHVGTEIHKLNIGYRYNLQFSHRDGVHFAYIFPHHTLGAGTIYRQFSREQGHLAVKMTALANPNLIDDVLMPQGDEPPEALRADIEYSDSGTSQITTGANNLYYLDTAMRYPWAWGYGFAGLENVNELYTNRSSQGTEEVRVVVENFEFVGNTESTNETDSGERTFKGERLEGGGIVGLNTPVLQPFAGGYSYPTHGWIVGTFVDIPHLWGRIHLQERDTLRRELESEVIVGTNMSRHNQQVIARYFRDYTQTIVDPLPGKESQYEAIRMNAYKDLYGAFGIAETDRRTVTGGILLSGDIGFVMGGYLHNYQRNEHGGYGRLGIGPLALYGAGHQIRNVESDQLGFSVDAGVVFTFEPPRHYVGNTPPHFYSNFICRNLFNDQAPLSNGYMQVPFANVEGPDVTSCRVTIGGTF